MSSNRRGFLRGLLALPAAIIPVKAAVEASAAIPDIPKVAWTELQPLSAVNDWSRKIAKEALDSHDFLCMVSCSISESPILIQSSYDYGNSIEDELNEYGEEEY